MFSGIIESLGTIREFVHDRESAAMVVETETNFSVSREDGESIAVNGVCLTVVDFNDSMLRYGSRDGDIKTKLVSTILK